MVLSRVWGALGWERSRRSLVRLAVAAALNLGYRFGRKTWFLGFLMLFVTRLRDCQVEADRKLFWDWFFPLPGSWHRAPCLKCNVITAVIQLLRERAGRTTYLWEMLKFPLCPLSAVQHMLGNDMRWAGGLCQEVPWYIWLPTGAGGCRLPWGSCRRSPWDLQSSSLWGEFWAQDNPQIHGGTPSPAVAEPSGRPGCLSCLQSPPST